MLTRRMRTMADAAMTSCNAAAGLGPDSLAWVSQVSDEHIPAFLEAQLFTQPMRLQTGAGTGIGHLQNEICKAMPLRKAAKRAREA